MELKKELLIIDWEKVNLLVDNDQCLLKHLFDDFLEELKNSIVQLEFEWETKKYYSMVILISQIKGSVSCFYCEECNSIMNSMQILLNNTIGSSLTIEKIVELGDLFEQFKIAVKRLFLEVEYYFYKKY
jgi:hypothetical protein